MRTLTAISLLSGLSALGLLACANRGMHAPDPDGGPGAAGNVATGGRGGQGGTTGRGGGGTSAQGGTGGGPVGGAGTGGTGQPSGTAGNCNAALTDGGAGGGACGTTFNFESGIHMAMISSGSRAFTAVKQSSAFTSCGSGALEITALFTGTSGATTRGEVLIPLPGAPVDLTNKTITVRVAADPGCSSDLYLSLVVNTQMGAYYFSPSLQVRPITNTWKMATGTVTADAGSMTALALSLQAFSQTGYSGTIYVDEIDIR